jgi:quercetin dioxygenase-like cupin family protein
MTLVPRLNRRALGLVVAAACAAGPSALANPKKQMVVVPADAARYVPVDPAHPDAAQMAVLHGDPAKGPSAMLLKFKKATGVLHVHTSDYHLILLQGTMKHRAKGQSEASAPPLGPGSYWFQPGNQPHSDSCLSDECVMYINWAGKRDAKAVPEP